MSSKCVSITDKIRKVTSNGLGVDGFVAAIKTKVNSIYSAQGCKPQQAYCHSGDTSAISPSRRNDPIMGSFMIPNFASMILKEPTICGACPFNGGFLCTGPVAEAFFR